MPSTLGAVAWSAPLHIDRRISNERASQLLPSSLNMRSSQYARRTSLVYACITYAPSILDIIRVCIINLPEITGGTPGMMGIPKHANFLVVYLAVVVTCMVIHLMMKSRHGRAILSIRENEIAAESCGINITYYKVLAFAVSSFFAGVAGALYAGYQGLLTPTSFDFMASINILVMVVLGGMGSMIGSVIAAAVLTSLPLALQALNTYRMVIYSILLIATMIFKPSGLMGTYDFSMSRLLERIINGKQIRADKKAKKAGDANG